MPEKGFIKAIRVKQRAYPIEYKIVAGKRSSVRIRDKKIIVRFSRWSLKFQREKMLREFINWAVNKLESFEESDFVIPDYHDGASICTHNKRYHLEFVFEKRTRAKTELLDGYRIRITLPVNDSEKRFRDLAEKLIIKDQTSYLHEVVSELNELYFQEKYKKLRFKRVKTRFGSCSNSRNITIAFRLLFAPREVFRYVCIHELAHLKEFNHSRRFWDLVREAMPEYKEHDIWLNKNGFMLG